MRRRALPHGGGGRRLTATSLTKGTTVCG